MTMHEKIQKEVEKRERDCPKCNSKMEKERNKFICKKCRCTIDIK